MQNYNNIFLLGLFIFSSLVTGLGKSNKGLIDAIKRGNNTDVHAILSQDVLLKLDELEKVEGYPGPVTPLMVAVYKGNVDIVDTLLRFGANPNVQDSQGRTALFYAHHKKTFEKLLEKSPNLSLKDVNGNIILHWVLASPIRGRAIGNLNLSIAASEIAAIVDMLLGEHANPNVLNNDEYTPYDLALLRYEGKNGFNRNWLLAITRTMTQAHLTMRSKTSDLIEQQVDEDLRPFIYAAFSHDISLEEAMVRAAYTGDLNALKKMIGRTTNIDTLVKIPEFPYSVTALMAAITKDKKDVVEFLINRGASLTVEDKLERTPLVFSQSYAMFRLILNKMIERKVNNAKILGKALAAILYNPQDWIFQEGLNAVTELIEDNADLKATYLGFTPLLAVLNNSVSFGDRLPLFVTLLLKAGADPKQMGSFISDGQRNNMDALQLTQSKLSGNKNQLERILEILEEAAAVPVKLSRQKTPHHVPPPLPPRDEDVVAIKSVEINLRTLIEQLRNIEQILY